MLNNYLRQVNKTETNPRLVSLRGYAEEHEVPIITEDGIHFLHHIIQLHGATSILEIGTAIGYSSIAMALENDVSITTIERDHHMCKIAQKNISEAQLDARITLIEGDALDVSLDDVPDVDLIFIDAAKAQNTRFFEKFKLKLRPNGVIVTDNLLFHGMVETEDESRSRALKALIKKIRDFNRFVVNHEEFDSYIYSVGDGMSVSIKKV